MSKSVTIAALRSTGDTARAYQWDMEILDNGGKLSTVAGLDGILNVRATSSGTPGVEWADIIVESRGFTKHERGMPSFSPFSIEVIEIHTYDIAKAMWALCNSYADHRTGVQTIKDDNEGGILVTLLDLTHADALKWQLIGVQFNGLPAFSLDNSKDGIITISLDFTFDDAELDGV